MDSRNEITRLYGTSTTVLAGTASATVDLPADSTGSTTAKYWRLVTNPAGAAHFRFGTRAAAAVTTDPMVTESGLTVRHPGGNSTCVAAISAVGVTCHLNLTVIEG